MDAHGVRYQPDSPCSLVHSHIQTLSLSKFWAGVWLELIAVGKVWVLGCGAVGFSLRFRVPIEGHKQQTFPWRKDGFHYYPS